MLKTKEAGDIIVDYPTEGQLIASPTYTFRIGAKDAKQVEVAINGSLWQPCRQAEGYWWYDWQDYQPGRHQITARLIRDDGTWTTKPRRFKVELPK